MPRFSPVSSTGLLLPTKACEILWTMKVLICGTIIKGKTWCHLLLSNLNTKRNKHFSFTNLKHLGQIQNQLQSPKSSWLNQHCLHQRYMSVEARFRTAVKFSPRTLIHEDHSIIFLASLVPVVCGEPPMLSFGSEEHLKEEWTRVDQSFDRVLSGGTWRAPWKRYIISWSGVNIPHLVFWQIIRADVLLIHCLSTCP